MPKVAIGDCLDGIPLSVACVSSQLGIPASTLRSWDRRYQIGPSVRTAGSHRRYTAVDIARLKLMLKLIDQGVSASDAAHQVGKQQIVNSVEPESLSGISVKALMQACYLGDGMQAELIIQRSIKETGLLDTWSDLLSPTLSKLRVSGKVSLPGSVPLVFLQNKILEAVQKIMQAAPKCKPDNGSALILSSFERVSAAAVIGAALKWKQVCPKQLMLSESEKFEVIKQVVTSDLPDVILAVEPSEKIFDKLLELSERTTTTVVVVSHDLPEYYVQKIVRLHSIHAAVAEVAEIIRTIKK